MNHQSLVDTIFNDKQPQFIEGFEVGKIYFLLKNRKVIEDLTIFKVNKETIEALCNHFGYYHKMNFPKGSLGTLIALPATINCN